MVVYKKLKKNTEGYAPAQQAAKTYGQIERGVKEGSNALAEANEIMERTQRLQNEANKKLAELRATQPSDVSFLETTKTEYNPPRKLSIREIMLQDQASGVMAGYDRQVRESFNDPKALEALRKQMMTDVVKVGLDPKVAETEVDHYLTAARKKRIV